MQAWLQLYKSPRNLESISKDLLFAERKKNKLPIFWVGGSKIRRCHNNASQQDSGLFFKGNSTGPTIMEERERDRETDILYIIIYSKYTCEYICIHIFLFIYVYVCFFPMTQK